MSVVRYLSDDSVMSYSVSSRLRIRRRLRPTYLPADM